MHFSLRDYESMASRGELSWRSYFLYPHLLFCSKCRKELKSYVEDRSLISDIKDAYARGEKIHMAMASRRASIRK